MKLGEYKPPGAKTTVQAPLPADQSAMSLLLNVASLHVQLEESPVEANEDDVSGGAESTALSAFVIDCEELSIFQVTRLFAT